MFAFRLSSIPTLFLGLALSVIGCVRSEHETEAEATTKAVVADRLSLTAEDRERLGILVAPVTTASIRTTKSAVGWFETVPAREAIVKAPLDGFVLAAPERTFPRQGESCSADIMIAQINAFISPQELSQMVQAREDNDILMQQSLVTMELTEAQLKRASIAADAITGVRIDQLKESLERAKAAYKETQDKIPFLLQEPYDDRALVKPVPVAAPISGRVLQIFVASGQYVQRGDALWTIADWSTLWLRIPVFETDVRQVVADEPAILHDPLSGNEIQARQVAVTTSTNATTRTVNFYYAVDNAAWTFRAGQSLEVELPTSAEQSVLLIPRSSLLFDGFGQPACYAAEPGSSSFERKRLEIGRAQGDQVIVKRGLDEDDIVVTAGAEQLAADESRSELAVEDDD